MKHITTDELKTFRKVAQIEFDARENKDLKHYNNDSSLKSYLELGNDFATSKWSDAVRKKGEGREPNYDQIMMESESEHGTTETFYNLEVLNLIVKVTYYVR